ncbi:hypothetical protein C1N62_12525 [Nissabacter sp. SGAir0207]|nr:hypothetical protein C1N62_12525 [Nissabacter sp. SGAir0207]
MNTEVFQITQAHILIDYTLMPLGLLQSQLIIQPIPMMVVLCSDGLQDLIPILWLKIHTTLVILVAFIGLQKSINTKRQ